MFWPRTWILSLVILVNPSAAQSCWRSTKCTGPLDTPFKGPWEANNYSPVARMVKPKRALALTGRLIGEYKGTTEFKHNGTTMVFDFGVEVGGVVSFDYTGNAPATVGLAFSESKTYIGQWSDSSNGKFGGPDGAFMAAFPEPVKDKTRFVMPDRRLRGGFRYLTVFLVTDEDNIAVRISNIQLEIVFQPTWPNLRAYQGYFHSSDQLLNKIWYSGAYTLQTNCAPTRTGRQVPMLSVGWANDGNMGPGETVMVDGAKRDRAVWPGDMRIAVPALFVSTGDLESIRNSLQVIYDYQNRDGSFPEAGPPLLQQGSDTYHMWTLVGTYNYVLYSDDMNFILKNWAKYVRAMDYILEKVKATGLCNIDGTRDWARWNQGGENSEANMILYQVFLTAAKLANWTNSASLSRSYIKQTFLLQDAINARLWDEQARAFMDNSTRTSVHPQDANSLAVLFGVIPHSTALDISRSLLRNWTPIGPEPPELPGNISPFITGFELQAHFRIGETSRAIDLLKRTWGWYLKHPNGTQSTAIEGYRTDGTWGYRAERGYQNDPSYVSHAHGWSAGPTSALTNYIAGLNVHERGGAVWSVKPQFATLDFAEAGFMTKLGMFRTKWEKILGTRGYDVIIVTPKGTTGLVNLPALRGYDMAVLLNGTATPWWEGPDGMEFELPGGSWNLSVRPVNEGPREPRRASSAYLRLLSMALVGVRYRLFGTGVVRSGIFGRDIF